MPLSGNISFKRGLQSAYDSLVEKDLNAVYFLSDTQRLFLGETEYTRPIQHGNNLPSGYNPPNSLFVLEKEDGTKELNYSQDGLQWISIAIFPSSITGGVFGENTKLTTEFGDTINIPQITVDNYGFIKEAKNNNIKLPSVSVLEETLNFS